MARVEGVTAPRFAMFVSMPLLKELVSINDGYGYRHGSPNGAVATRQQGNPPETGKNRELACKSNARSRLHDPHGVRLRAIPGESPSKHRRRGQNAADATAGGAGWISVADQKRGLEGVLWYQGLSGVCPGCPQTTPREARKASWIREAYAGHRPTNIEHPTSSEAKPRKATQSRTGAKAEG
jgi:hypothetical protein